jgi:RHS repeat-associated protein
LTGKRIEDGGGAALLSEGYTYDGAGRVIRTDSMGGRFREFAYFPDGAVREIKVNGTPVQTTTRDQQGRVTRQEVNQVVMAYAGFTSDTALPQLETVSFKNGSGSVTTQKTYDRMGRPTRVTVPAGSWEYGYDGFGNITRRRDADGVEVRQTFSPGGRPLTTTFADGTAASFTYTAQQRLDRIVTGAGTLQFGYDTEGLIRSIDYPDATRDLFLQRNAFFEPEEVIQGEDVQLHTWDEGRLASIAQPAKGDLQEFEYDALGQRTRVSFNGEDVEYGFNGFGDLSSEAGWAGAYDMTLNERQHLLRATYPSGLVVDYQPDTFGQPLAVGAAGITSISWTAPSLPDTILYGQSLRVQRLYDVSLRLTNVTYRLGTSPNSPVAAGIAYALTPGGRILSEERMHQGAFDVFTRNGPIDGMRVTDILFGAADAAGTGSAAALRGFSFALGELQTPSSQSNPGLSPGGDIRGFFPALSYQGGRVAAIDGQTLAFTGSGSMSAFPVWVRLPGQSAITRVGATAGYDGLGMVREVSRVDGVTVTYRRDGLGRIVERTVAGPANRCRPGATRYAWQGRQLIEVHAETDPGQFHLAQRFIYLGSVPVLVQVAAVPGPGAVFTDYVPLVTLNGSLGGYLTPAGDLVETINYTAYGYPVFLRDDLDGTLPRERSRISNTLLFQGQWFDEATGLYQLGQRNLHPLCGLFLQRDNALFSQSLAFFTAFNGDPAGRVDPTGLASAEAVTSQGKELADAVKAAKEAYKSMLGVTESDVKGELSGLTGAAQYTDALTKGIAFATTFSDADTKKMVEAGQSLQEVFKTGADILKSYGDMRKDRDLLNAIKSVTYAGIHGRTGKLDWFYKDGAAADLVGISAMDRQFGQNKAYVDALLKRNKPQELLTHYREQRDHLGRQRLKNLVSVGSGLKTLSKIYREKVLTGDDTLSKNLNQMLKTSEALTDVVSAGAEFYLEHDDLIKFRHGMGLRSGIKYSRLLDKGPRNALSASFTFGFEFGKLLVMAISDEEAGKTYMKATEDFAKNGGWITVAGGVLSMMNMDDAAFALQQYADFSLTDMMESVASSLMAERARQVERTQTYLKGISAP